MLFSLCFSLSPFTASLVKLLGVETKKNIRQAKKYIKLWEMGYLIHKFTLIIECTQREEEEEKTEKRDDPKKSQSSITFV